MVRTWLSGAALLLISACGKGVEPATPSLSDPAGAGATPTSSAAPTPAATADPEAARGADQQPARRRKPFPIHNACSEVATIVFGDDPKAGAGRRTVAPSSSIDGPRDADGKQTVWLLDDKGEPLVNVHVTRGMKQLEIGRSCRTLDAR